MKLYGKSLWFKRGLMLNVYLTLRCNLNCDFCCVKANRVQCPESTVSEWQIFFETFGERIKEVSVSGGEPTLYPGYSRICNGLLDMGVHVSLATNLLNLELHKDAELFNIMPQYRFQISATCHQNPLEFMTAVNSLRAMGYRVNVRVLPEQGELPIKGVRLKWDSEDDLWREKVGLHVTPNRLIFGNVMLMRQELEARCKR